MQLHNTNLVIHIGDKVGFFTSTNEGDNVHITGIVTDIASDDILTLKGTVNEFLNCTIAAANVDSVNNLFISLNNFRDNLNISVGV